MSNTSGCVCVVLVVFVFEWCYTQVVLMLKNVTCRIPDITAREARRKQKIYSY